VSLFDFGVKLELFGMHGGSANAGAQLRFAPIPKDTSSPECDREERVAR
jgi:hypothetical protein